MSRWVEMFQGERGEISFARVQGVGCFAMVSLCTMVLTVKQGVPMDIPESWLTLLALSTGGYLGAKGIAAAKVKPDEAAEPTLPNTPAGGIDQ